VKLKGALWASPNARRLLVVSLIDSAGNGAYVSAGVVLFSTVLHLSATQIGQGFAAGATVGLILSVWWGSLADKLGVRTVLLSLQLWRAVGCALFVFANNFTVYLAVVVFLGIAERASPPILLAFVASALGESNRVKIAGALRSIRNAGFTVGALGASLALISPGRLSLAVVVLGNSASFVFAAAMLRGMPFQEEAKQLGRSRKRKAALKLRRRPAFLVATALTGALSVHRQVLSVGLPLWIVTRKLAPTSMVSALVAVNTVLVVVLQVRMTKKSEDALGAARVLRLAALALLAFAALLGVSLVRLPYRPWSIGAVLVVATILLTLAEMWQAAGAWGMSLALSPAAARSRFLSVFNLGSSALDVSGALLLTTWVLPASWIGWLVFGGVLAMTGLMAPPVARWAEREREHTEAHAVLPNARHNGHAVAFQINAIKRHRAGSRHLTWG